MDVSKEFLSNFHNLGGFTIAEKSKNLFMLLNSVKSLDQNSLNELISSVTPRDYLESIFQVEMLIQFRRTEDLFRVLKNESENLLAKIFRQPWFFQEPFTNLPAELIVNDLLPNLSFVTRNRVIKCLGKYHKDEIKCDQVFDKLLERYGINSAKQILRGCSIEKCQEVFKSHRGYIQLPSSDLIPLFNKDPHLLESYVELCDRDLDEGIKIIQEVILKEPDMYLDLRKKIYSTSLGKRSTRRLLIHSKEHIVSKASAFSGGLHLRTVYKFLGRKDAEIFLQNLFPKNQSEFSYYGIKGFLKHFPKTERFTVFTNIFEKVYEKSAWDDDKVLLCDSMLEIIHNEEDRLKWIDLKIRSGTSPDTFYHFYEINKALGLIKEKINMTKKMYLRRSLIDKLIFVCKFKNDVRALRDVLEYYCKHHKNEDNDYNNYFLRELDSSFDLTELSEEHWKFINEILHMQQLGKEKSDKRKIILLKYIVYLWKNKCPVRERIVDLIQNENLSVRDWYSVDFKCIKLEKEFINAMEEILSQKTNDPKLLIEENLALLYYIRSKENDPKNEISLRDYPRLTSFITTYVQKALKDKYFTYQFHYLFESFVGTKEDEFSHSITKMYFEYGLEEYTKENIILRYLKNDPSFLSKYADQMVKGLCSGLFFKPEIWTYVKKLTYVGLYEKSVQYCLEHYTEASGYNARSMLTILAYLMHPEDYVALVSKHMPRVERIDIEDDESKRNYDIEVAVASSLKITKSVLVLPTLISFCVGDYLRDALESLYYLFYHSPENKLDTFLKQLSNRAVSVRKHTFFLISQVGSAQSVFTMLKSAIEHEKNASVKKHILNTTFRYFKKNPLDNFCELLMSCIPFLNSTDTESLRVIQSVKEVPEKFQGRYFISVLEYLKSLADKNHEASKEADEFLSKINSSIMKRIPYDFCISFIDKYFLKKDDCFSEENVEVFTREFLFYCDHDFTEKLDIILNKLVEFHKNNRSEIGLDIQARKKINAIISEAICHFTYNDDVAQLQIFYNRVLKFFEVDEYFENYVRLKCLLLKKESLDIVEYTSKMRPFFNELTAKYGSDLTKTFASGIKRCLTYAETRDDGLYKLCFEFWKNSKTVSDYLLIILLLPNEVPDEHHHVAFFQLLENLESHSDILVRITLNSYLQSLNLSDLK